MTQDDLSKMSKEELIELTFQVYGENVQLKVEVEALKLKLEKNKKPPTNSSNSSQPPSKDQKPKSTERQTQAATRSADGACEI